MSPRPALWLALPLLAGGCGTNANAADYVSALARADAGAIHAIEQRLPACADARCLPQLVHAFGGKHGLRTDPPDQPSAAAAAAVLARDGHGEWLPARASWLRVLREGKGPGADALRLAVSAQLLHAFPAEAPAAPVDDEATQRAWLRRVSAALPAACAGYAALGAGAALNTLAPADHPDTAACVRDDLGDREAAGAHYSRGVHRATAAALGASHALWRALQAGLPHSSQQAALQLRLDALAQQLPRWQLAEATPVRPPSDERLQRAHEQAGVPWPAASASEHMGAKGHAAE